MKMPALATAAWRMPAARFAQGSDESFVYRSWLSPTADATTQRGRDGRLLGLNYLLATAYILAVVGELGPHLRIEVVLAGAIAAFGVTSLVLPWRRLPEGALAWSTAAGFALVTLTQGWLGQLSHFGPPYSLGFAFAGLVLGARRTRQMMMLSLFCLAVVIACGRQHDQVLGVIAMILVGGMMGELVAASTASRRRQHADLQRLQSGITSLLGVRDQAQAAGQIARLAADLLKADGVTVATLDPLGTLVVRGGHGRGEPLLQMQVHDWKDRPGLGQVLGHSQQVFAPQAATDPRLDYGYAQKLSIASLLFLPLLGQDGPIGVVSIWWQTPVLTLDTFGEQVVQLLSLQAGPVLERAQEVDELDRAAVTDQLTGIGNRRAFERRLVDLPDGAALVLCDLDRFKILNDTQGHPAGDRILRAFAAVAASCVRSEDLVARIGGDEFALIVVGGEGAARSVIERLRRDWNDPEGVGFSAGYAAQRIGEDAYQLNERADQELYAQKRRSHARSR